jgi:putative phosphoesterase
MKIGVLSDTHNYLDPQIESLFEGVDHILHAGDVGQPWLLLQLQQMAPVTAVLGNTDSDVPLRETEVCELDGISIVIHHIVNPHALSQPLAERIRRVRPQMVVYGHTHRAAEETIGETLFLNPGYAGRPRFHDPRSVAFLHVHGPEIRPEFVQL